MQLDWSDLLQMAGVEGKELLELLKPYLPALAREGPDVYDGFISHLRDGDFELIDQMLYEKMSLEERRALEEQVYKDAYEATAAKFRRKELAKEILFRVTVNLALKLATGGFI
jgi:hypothetical protein